MATDRQTKISRVCSRKKRSFDYMEFDPINLEFRYKSAISNDKGYICTSLYIHLNISTSGISF